MTQHRTELTRNQREKLRGKVGWRSEEMYAVLDGHGGRLHINGLGIAEIYSHGYVEGAFDRALKWGGSVVKVRVEIVREEVRCPYQTIHLGWPSRAVWFDGSRVCTPSMWGQDDADGPFVLGHEPSGRISRSKLREYALKERELREASWIEYKDRKSK